jgi:HEAT repeat protein
MGLLGLFKKSGAGAVKKHAARVGNKRAQSPDRWEAIRALGEIGTPEAVDALLQRFTIRVDPSITDQEEKEAACDAIARAGDSAVDPVRRFLRQHETLAWPMKCLARLVPDEQITGELVSLLESMDTEYERNPEKKIQVLSALEERKDPRIIDAVKPFLDDVNETTRFHSVGTLLAQVGAEDESAEQVRQALLEALLAEESVRVRSSILDGFIERGWTFGERKDDAKAKLPPGYAVDSQGKPSRS